MKYAVYSTAGLLGVLGLLFLVAAGHSNAVVRVVIGVICLSAATALIFLAHLRPVTHVHRTRLDLSGDVSLEQLTCRQCGASLTDTSVRVAAGAVFVRCEFCGAQYQIEEAPKW